MLTLFKKQPTVEEIHAEFDNAEEKILAKCDEILKELNIPTETQVERKAEMIKSLGFVNSEIVVQAQKIKEKTKSIQKVIEVTSTQAQTIREFKIKYPNEKFITIDELERICEKYNLIHAPAKNYIKDIPEKNVLEMKNVKPLQEQDKLKLFQILTLKRKYFSDNTPEYVVDACVKGIELKNVVHNGYNNNECINTHFGFDNYCNYYRYHSYDYHVQLTDKSGLFVAAPKSHFDLGGLDKKSKFGFFKVEVKEVKDPVVFEYCKNNICRIVTKWGTDDDQSYLDSTLLNEILN